MTFVCELKTATLLSRNFISISMVLTNTGTKNVINERALYRDVYPVIRYDTIRYDSVCLTCSKKLTGSQLSLQHGTNKKLKCKTKNKMMSMIAPVQSRYREAVQ